MSNLDVSQSIENLKLSDDSGGYDSAEETLDEGENLINSSDWLSKKKHLFILSESGKPVYSRYGKEDNLVTLYGLLQALVSIVSDGNDTLQCVEAGRHKFVFLVKSPLILVSVVESDASVEQLQLQLTYVNRQVESVATRAALHRTYSKRRNCDLRDLLGGTDRLINNLLLLQDTNPGLLMGAYEIMPLSQSIRSDITSAIVNACSKIKNLVFGLVLSGTKLITLVKLKGQTLQTADLHLLINLVSATDSLRDSENWMPICLPQFDPDGYLYGHVSYLSEGCNACLMLLTVDKELFYTLSTAKQKVTEKLRRQHILEKLASSTGSHYNSSLDVTTASYDSNPIDLNTSMSSGNLNLSAAGDLQQTAGEAPVSGGSSLSHQYNVTAVGCKELRHFVYKNRTLEQYTMPVYSAPYAAPDDSIPCDIYHNLHRRLRAEGCNLKMIYTSADDHSAIGWLTSEFELYAILEPLTTKQNTIVIVNRILKFIKQEESKLFMLSTNHF